MARRAPGVMSCMGGSSLCASRQSASRIAEELSTSFDHRVRDLTDGGASLEAAGRQRRRADADGEFARRAPRSKRARPITCRRPARPFARDGWAPSDMTVRYAIRSFRRTPGFMLAVLADPRTDDWSDDGARERRQLLCGGPLRPSSIPIDWPSSGSATGGTPAASARVASLTSISPTFGARRRRSPGFEGWQESSVSVAIEG